MTLLYKEMRLVAHPTSIVFAFLGCLVLVPSYPYSVIFMFGCLAPYITFNCFSLSRLHFCEIP